MLRDTATIRRAREAINLLGEIDPDGIEDTLELVRFTRLYEAGEIQGRDMYCRPDDLAFLRDLHGRQFADAYGIAA